MARILLSYYRGTNPGNYKDPLCFYDGLIKKLVENGNDVLAINTVNFTLWGSNKLINNKDEEDILVKVKKFDPELIITFQNAVPDFILNSYPRVPLVLWVYDEPGFIFEKKYVKENIKKYKLFTSDTLYPLYRDFGFSNHQISIIDSATAVEKKTIVQDVNISFLGTVFYSTGKIKQLLLKNNDNQMVNKLVLEYLNEENFDYEGLLKKYSNNFEDFKLNSMDLYPLFDLRVYTLLACLDFGLKICGTRWEEYIDTFPFLYTAFDKSIIWSLEENIEFYNRSKISLSITHPQGKDVGYSWRCFDIMASNACLVTSKSSTLQKMTRGIVDIPMFHTPFEARAICQELLKDDRARKQIVDSSQKFVNDHCRWEHRFKDIENILNIKLINKSKKGTVDFINRFHLPQRNNLNKTSLSFKYKMYYNLWTFLNKKLIKKGILTGENKTLLSINYKKRNFSLKNKIRYKIWKHLYKSLFKDNAFIKEDNNFYKKIQLKIWSYLNFRLSKKGIIDKKYLEAYFEYRNKAVFANLVKKYKKKGIIKVAFLHQYATGTQAYPIFDKMLASDIFNPYWIVNPDVLRSKNNFDYQYRRTKDTLIAKYGKERVLDGYDYQKNKYIDYTNSFDLATTTNPYEAMANKLFKIEYWTSIVPMFYISYFYMGRCFVTIDNLKSLQFSYFWKVFSENNYVKELAKKYQLVKGKNIDVVGYAKMDALSFVKVKKRNRKRVIIAPHHSIEENEMSCGAFLQFSDVILELPKKYPNIDFVYRPHPLLEEKLNKIWGNEKTKSWLEKILSYPNVEYSVEGEYFDLFVNSDALIHDCGSFMAEYLFVNHPCAYFINKNANYSKIHTAFGHRCMDAHTLIYNKNDLFNFIDTNVIQGNDEKKDYREAFVKDELIIDNQDVTDKIINIIKREITGE